MVEPIPLRTRSQPDAAGQARRANKTYRFGDFVLDPAARSLARGTEPVRLSARGFDLLTVLVERRGEVVSKQDLFQLVWPRGFVEESNLRVQMAALRRALDDPRDTPRFIASVPGRGYSFVAIVGADEAAPAPAPRMSLPAGMPVAARRQQLIGRDAVLDALVDTLASKRLVTLVGTGGLGKTSVALATAERMADRFRDGVLVVDLAPLAGGELVAAHVASLLRVPAANAHPIGAISEHLLNRQMLIVLDNCEHVVKAVCELAEQVALNCPQVRLLATSREALHAQGEVVRRLAPLPTPQATAGITASAAMAYASVQLMMARVRSHDESLAITDQNAGLVCDICVSLDGLPLAIELAATRVPVFGFDGLASLLGHRFRMLVGRDRGADGRHRTLGATIDWSYDWLVREEQAMLRALSAFAGPFTLAAAQAVAAAPGFDPVASAELLASLVEKSLIAADHAGGRTRYRLFESVRIYARERLEALAAEHDAVRRAHAAYFEEHAGSATESWADLPDEAWMREHAQAA
jgi:predicted ATPase/DNA-binding winged helix-turn-helix (wHTH) protein